MFEVVRYRMFCFFLEQRLRHERDTWSAVDSLGGEKAQQLMNFRAAERVGWLCSALRRTPAWGEGHLLYGEESLSLGNTSAAFASAQAALALAARPALNSGSLMRERGLVLLAECYLSTGESSAVLEMLAPLKEQAVSQVDGGGPRGKIAERVLSAYAGALLLEGNEQEASALLQRAPRIAQRSESHALIQYAQRKAQGQLQQLH